MNRNTHVCQMQCQLQSPWSCSWNPCKVSHWTCQSWEEKKKQWGLNHHVQNIFRSPKTKPEVSSCFQRCFSAQRSHNTATTLERHTHALTDGRQAASHTHSQHPKPQPQLQPLAPAVAFGYRVLLERNAERGTERYGFSLYIKKNPTNKPTNKNKAANNTSLKMRFQVCGILTPVLQLLKSTELCNDCP